MEEYLAVHKTYHKFSNWLQKTFGKDLYGEWQTMSIPMPDGKFKKIKHRSFNDIELSRRLVGYKVIEQIQKYIKKSCPEIKIVNCDDDSYAGSIILLIPHPSHGITMMFIPQCTNVQNKLFLYDNHYQNLLDTLKNMKSVFKSKSI